MRHRPSSAMFASTACLVGLVATGVLARLTAAGQVHDDASLYGFMRLNHPGLGRAANVLVSLGDPPVYAAFGVLFVAVALLRGLPRLGLAIPVAMAGAVASTELLKPLIAIPRVGHLLGTAGQQISDASWPSGHATAAMALALCAVLASPRALRPLIGVLGTFAAIGAGYGLLVLAWHFPSDVFGGYLMAGLWVSLALAGLWWADLRWPAQSGRRAVARVAGLAQTAPAALVAVLLCGAAALAALRGGDLAELYAVGHASFLASAAALAGLAGGLVFVLSFALRSPER